MIGPDEPDPRVESPANHLRYALATLRGLLREDGRGHLPPLNVAHRAALERAEARVRAALRGIEGGEGVGR